MNPRKPEDFKNLVNAVNESRRKMAVFREKRTELLSIFVGSEYSDDAEAKNVYLNLIAQATNVYVRQLAVRAPTANVTTPYKDLRPQAAELELACAQAADEMMLGDLLRKCATEALFSPLACVKMGTEYVGSEDLAGSEIDITQVFASRVSFDDYVRDMSARGADKPYFEGDTYTISKEEFDRRYGAKARDVTVDDLELQDDEATDRGETLSHEPLTGDDNFDGKVELQDIWLRNERLLVTYIKSRPGRVPLDVVEYDTDEEGPYHCLWFTDVPDNAMPLPPFSLLKNIHELANSLFRRMAYQARNQKRVAGFNSEDSANRFKTAHDGEGIYWDGQKPESIEVGGIDQNTFALFLQVKELFSWSAGNLDALGGLSPQAETATQDKMLAQSASAQLADMQDAMTEFARKLFKQVAWYEWTDPIRERIIERRAPGGVDVSVPIIWSEETRKGDFLDFNFNIVPQSMRDDAPGLKIQKLNQLVSQFIIPMMPMLQSQGVTFDAREFINILADYGNMPELKNIVVSIDPNALMPTDQPAGNSQPFGKPANTTRTYERVNRPGATRGGKEVTLQQLLLGGGAQSSEIDAIGRGNT